MSHARKTARLAGLGAFAAALLLLISSASSTRADTTENFEHHDWAKPTSDCKDKEAREWWAGVKRDAEIAEAQIAILNNAIDGDERLLAGLRKEPPFKAKAPEILRRLIAKRRLLARWKRQLAYARELIKYYEGLPECVRYAGDPPPPKPHPWPGPFVETLGDGPVPERPLPPCKNAATEGESRAIPAQIEKLNAERDKLALAFAADADEAQGLEMTQGNKAGMANDPTLIAKIAAVRARMDTGLKRIAEIEAETGVLAVRKIALDGLDPCTVPPPACVPAKPAVKPILNTPFGEDGPSGQDGGGASPPPAPRTGDHSSAPRPGGVLHGGVLAGVGVQPCPPATPGKDDEDGD
jgi:hypothetical protein